MERRDSLQMMLPGERQGVDAGHDSMQVVGGRVLKRRVHIAQEITTFHIQVNRPWRTK